MNKCTRLSLVVVAMVVLLFASPGSASADWLDKLGARLDEVSATLDKVNATLNTTIAGPSPDSTKVLEQAQGQTPTADAFVGKWEESWELNSGKATHEEFKKSPGFVTEPTMLARVGKVAQRLCKNVERKNLDYHFAILKSNDLNAFAAPGGYIYVTEGLMKAIGSDDELAGVLAHELGHVQKKHSVRAMEKNAAMLAIVAGLATWEKTRKYSWVGALGAYFAKQSFSRSDEFEADSIAVDLTIKSGYDPQGLVRFFDRINKDTKFSKYTKYVSTHPPTTERIKRVEALIAKKAPLIRSSDVPVTVPQQTTSGTSTTSGGVGPTVNSPFPTQGGGNTSGTTTKPTTTTTKPTNEQLRQAYEVYLYTKQQYEYAVQIKAPIDTIMTAYNQYNAARDRYMAMRKAAGL